jgi:hypothetical protein
LWFLPFNYQNFKSKYGNTFISNVIMIFGWIMDFCRIPEFFLTISLFDWPVSLSPLIGPLS